MIKYNPKDFLLENYSDLLKRAKNRFVFSQYIDFHKHDNFILWRHDIDFSVEQALELAKIEKSLGIQATYFIHLHSLFYNPLEKELSNLLREILALGHHFGLHFDCEYYEIKQKEELIYWLEFEKRILEQLFKISIPVFSFHNTTPFTMSLSDDIYAGMINTYSLYFQKQVPYCSDSNGYWRYRRLQNVLEDQSIKNLHVLTHPEWWLDKELLPRDKIIYHTKKSYDKCIEQYDSALKSAARHNLGELISKDKD